jgi:two-component system sensor histidine kinase KdpD
MDESGPEQEINRLRRALALRDVMVDLAGHDLRKPLHSLSIALAELDNPELPNPERKQFAAAARRSLGKMDRILTDFIDINRLDSGKLAMEVQPVAATWLLEKVRTEHTAAATAAGFAIDLAIEAELPEFLADPDRAAQALGNLVVNAVRFARGGSTISLEAAQDGDEVVLTVRDDGPGFAASTLPDPFDRLSEAAMARRARGIGLPLAQGLVNAMGGTIAAANAADGGAEIRIRFRAVR